MQNCHEIAKSREFQDFGPDFTDYLNHTNAIRTKFGTI